MSDENGSSGEETTVDWEALGLASPTKTAVSIRIDDDVLAFFKSSGRGYQTRINAVLRAFMRAQKRTTDEN